MVIPAYFRKLKEIELIVPNIVNVLKTLVIGNLIETPSNHISADEMKIILKVCVNFSFLPKLIMNFFIACKCSFELQLKSDETAHLLNKPYVNEVTLRGQKQPLKCC